MNAETVSAWAPILIALFSLIGTVVAGYFAYRSRQDAAKAVKVIDEQTAVIVEQTEMVDVQNRLIEAMQIERMSKG